TAMASAFVGLKRRKPTVCPTANKIKTTVAMRYSRVAVIVLLLKMGKCTCLVRRSGDGKSTRDSAAVNIKSHSGDAVSERCELFYTVSTTGGRMQMCAAPSGAHGFDFAHPGLPAWANSYRASGAASLSSPPGLALFRYAFCAGCVVEAVE